MKVCIVVEGCYPYVMGGVSSWIQSLINAMPDVEFVVQTIIASRAQSGKFLYTLPENVTAVHEIYLTDDDWAGKRRRRKYTMSLGGKQALSDYICGREADLKAISDLFDADQISLNDMLMGEDFLDIAREFYSIKYDNLQFSDFVWTLRSMYLPLFYALRTPPPEADFYHAVATGYSGIFSACAKLRYGAPSLLISEHGVYTREREEELIKAKWVRGEYKDVWIDFFYHMSHYSYLHADKVTSLFEDVRGLQIEMGCPAEKTIVTPNGIDYKSLEGAPGKDENDEFINAGAVLRIAPIKDVKTMISAFALAKRTEPRLKLWLMGPYDEQDEYARECFQLVRALDVRDVVFTGRIQVKDYVGKMDMLLLTSISEGQPLTILEGYAVKKPTIATNVGNCRGLIMGEADDFGPAGIVAPVMGVEKIADAILTLARDLDMAKRMGEVGYKRLLKFYTIDKMRGVYRDLYNDMYRKKEEREWRE